MLKNAYFLAKIGADTAENEQQLAEILPIGRRVAAPCGGPERLPRRRRPAPRSTARTATARTAAASCSRAAWWRPPMALTSQKLAKMAKVANFCKILAGSFSAVSKRNFAIKYAFDSIFQALQDLHPFAPLQSQNFRKKSV